MDKKIFQEYTDEQRLSLLKDNASSLLEDYGYEKPLTDQQVKDLKNKIANCVSELRKEKLNKSREMKAYTDRIKGIEKTLDTSSEELPYQRCLCFPHRRGERQGHLGAQPLGISLQL